MSEEHVFDLLPGYAIGSLDEDDLIQVSTHLSNCAICRGELAAYWDTVDYLAQAAPVRNPPAGLKAKIMRRVEKRAGQVAARKPGLADFFRSLAVRPASFAWAALLLLVVFLSVSSLLLWREVNTLQAQSPGGDAQIIRLLGTENAPQAQAYLVIFPHENYGTLVVEDAPALEPGQQYQLWLIQDGKRTNGGVFSVNDDGYGALEINADQPLDKFPSFGVTIEPEGGSPGPTGKKVLGVDL